MEHGSPKESARELLSASNRNKASIKKKEAALTDVGGEETIKALEDVQTMVASRRR